MIFILLLINILLIQFVKTDNKYWVTSILLFVLLLIAFVSWRIVSENNVKQQESKYWQSAGTKSYGDFKEWTTLEEMRKEKQLTNAVFFDLLVLQTFLTFVFQVIGTRKTNIKLYRWTSLTFGIMFIAFVWLRVIITIVPTRVF